MSDVPTSEYVIIERAALAVLAADGLDVPALLAAQEVAAQALAAEGAEYRRFFLAGTKTETHVCDRQVGTIGRPEISAVILATCEYATDALKILDVLGDGTEFDRADPSYPDGIPAADDEEPF